MHIIIAVVIEVLPLWHMPTNWLRLQAHSVTLLSETKTSISNLIKGLNPWCYFKSLTRNCTDISDTNIKDFP